MKNATVLLLLVLLLGALLAKQGVYASRLCFECSDCPSVSAGDTTTSCPGSCYAVVTCKGSGKTPDVDRFCSNTNHDKGCIASSSSSSSPYKCYCNEDHCDAFAVVSDLCDGAASIAASLSLVLIAASLLCRLG